MRKSVRIALVSAACFLLFDPREYQRVFDEPKRRATECLSWAVMNDDPGLVRYLIWWGADVTEPLPLFASGYGNRPVGKLGVLTWAAMRNRLRAARVLLECGADPNTQERFLTATPLELATDFKYWRMRRLLIMHGAKK